jgi:hypothetical protein
LGHFFVSKNPNEPTKSSLTVKKFAQSGHPTPNPTQQRQHGGKTLDSSSQGRGLESSRHRHWQQERKLRKNKVVKVKDKILS